MKIAFYIAGLSMESGGAYTYSTGILRLLLSSERINAIYLIYSKDQKDHIKVFLEAKKIVPVLLKKGPIWNLRHSLAKKYYQRFYVTGKRRPALLRFSNLFNPSRSFFNSFKADVVHVPYQTAPVYGIKTPVIITMHDVQELHFPEYFSSHLRLDRALNFKRAMDEADKVIVSFKHVKDDLFKYFEIDDTKVLVCPAPLAENWFAEKAYLSQDDLRKKYDLPESFILYPAATWQHKNHINLIKALSLLVINKKNINLICTGSITKFHEIIKKQIDLLNLDGKVQFLGIVPEKDLIGLYHAARLVVIPTIYEAGSAPLFEAMRYGAPVICSNATSLPESIGDYKYVFNPHDPQEIAKLIEMGCYDEDFRKNNRLNSSKRIEYYKSQDYLASFLNAYEDIARKL